MKMFEAEFVGPGMMSVTEHEVQPAIYQLCKRVAIEPQNMASLAMQLRAANCPPSMEGAKTAMTAWEHGFMNGLAMGRELFLSGTAHIVEEGFDPKIADELMRILKSNEPCAPAVPDPTEKTLASNDAAKHVGVGDIAPTCPGGVCETFNSTPAKDDKPGKRTAKKGR